MRRALLILLLLAATAAEAQLVCPADPPLRSEKGPYRRPGYDLTTEEFDSWLLNVRYLCENAGTGSGPGGASACIDLTGATSAGCSLVEAADAAAQRAALGLGTAATQAAAAFAAASHTHPSTDISDSTAAGRTLLTAADAAAQRAALGLDLSSYTGNVLLMSPNGRDFIGIDDTVGAISAGDGTASSSINTWPDGLLSFSWGDGTLNGGNGASLAGRPVSGNLELTGGGAITGGPATTDSLTLGANSADGVGNGNTVAGAYIKLAGDNAGADGGVYIIPGPSGSISFTSHDQNTSFSLRDDRVTLTAANGYAYLAGSDTATLYSGTRSFTLDHAAGATLVGGNLTAPGFIGPLTGNASTATALVANGANCSGGQIPLGVDASGAVEGCYAPTSSTVGLANVTNDAQTKASILANTATDDTVPTGNGTSFDLKAIPNCTDSGGSHLNYTAATNTWSCGTTGDGTGSANAFSTVDASSGTDPVADTSSDTLAVTGGTGITVTGDSSTDTITVASTLTPAGSGSELQYRSSGSAFGAVTSSSVSGANVTFGGVTDGGTQFNLENLRLDGNTISTTDTNGNMVLSPNGSGRLSLWGTTSSFPAIRRNGAGLELVVADNSVFTSLKGTSLTATSSFVTNSGYLISDFASGTIDFSGTTVRQSPIGLRVFADANNSYVVYGNASTNSELLTLNTGSTTSVTSTNIIPANSVVDAILIRITTTITTAANFTVAITGGSAWKKIGTATTSLTTLTAGTTYILRPPAYDAGDNTSATTVTLTFNANPGAGVVRITPIVRTFNPPLT